MWDDAPPCAAWAGVLAEESEGVRFRPAGFFALGDVIMKFINSLFASELGSSSTKLALMIGLSSSMVLVLARIGVAVAGQ